MAAPVLSVFDSTPATIVADIKAKVLLSSDWANITGDIVKATADNGAQMVVNLAKAAAGNTVLNLAVWRTHDGTTGVDEKNYFVPWKRTTAITSASSDPLHVKVSAGKNHLYIEIEGPRGGEANAESATAGSARQSFFLGAITSYWDGTTDPAPCVVAVGNYTSASMASQPLAYVSRNAANAASWVPAYLLTLSTVAQASLSLDTGNPVGLDGKTYLMPWVVMEIGGGIRGRLTVAWYGGPSSGVVATASDPVLSRGQRFTYGGLTYELMATFRSTGGATAAGYITAWASGADAASGGANLYPLVAIPVA